MRKYNFFPYEKGYCVCSCLQSVLERRNRKVPPQDTIAKKIGDSIDGLNLNEFSLKEFLSDYSLESSYRGPFGVLEPDLILREGLNKGLDVIVAYSYNNILDKGQRTIGHTSLVSDFNEGRKKEVLLFDWDFPESFLKSFSLYDLVNSMRNIKNSGFYLINQKR